MLIDSKQYNGPCSCGRTHEMSTELVVIESGCMRRLDEYAAAYGLQGHRTAVYDRNTYQATEGARPPADAEIILDPSGLHADEHGIAALMGQLRRDTRLLVAVGAGTIHDLTRYCAFQLGVPFISCPTAASVDGFCSSVAAMTLNNCKKTLPAASPRLVLADLEVVKNAPIRLARSGYGDMVGKFIALSDWRVARILTGEFYCERIASLTMDATRAALQCAEGIAKGEESAFEKLTYGLLLSGLAMQMMGNSRPASGAEHHVSHIIEMEPPALGVHSDALHGEKVGVATILASREYHRMAESRNCWQDYPGLTWEYLYSIFGEEQAQGMAEENAADSAAGITARRMEECWPEIRQVIASIPTAQELTALYQTIGAKTTLSDIGVPDEKAAALLDWSPCVRCRLTLMRLRRCLK